MNIARPSMGGGAGFAVSAVVGGVGGFDGACANVLVASKHATTKMNFRINVFPP
jgi:hypothetical protein